MSRIIPIIFILIASTTHAQSLSLPETQTQDKFGLDCAYENFFFQPSVAISGAGIRPTFTAGATIGQYFTKPAGKGFKASPQFELGIVGPLPGGHPMDGLVRMNYMFARKLKQRPLYPAFTLGYSRLFVTGDALNFGLNLDIAERNNENLFRIELHDTVLLDGPQPQQIIGIRIAFGKLISD